MSKTAFDPSIVREYDIRGVYGETLTRADATNVGLGFGARVRAQGGRRVCVGRDGRLSSPALEAALCDGLAKAGVEASRVGVGPTPMLYFSVFHLDADGGVMVTGSHNPPGHNGFKMMLGKQSFFGDEIRALAAAVAQGLEQPGGGSCHEVAVFDAYVERLLQGYEGAPLKALWDPGNGAAGNIVKALCRRLPGRHDVINGEIDGTFPNHHPDPTDPDNLAQLIKGVREGGYDMGLAFDGDGDRIGAVDGDGEIVWGDQILALLSREVLKKVPGGTIIADVKSSNMLFDTIRAAGGHPLLWKTGHSVIKAKMLETGAPLAGEMSGHIFFNYGYYGFDDALFAALRLIEAVGRSGPSLADMRRALPRYYNTPELRFACPAGRKFEVPEEIKSRLAAAGNPFLDIDGVRVQTDDGWWLLRASNTQDLLVARCESSTPDGLVRLKQGLADQLQMSGIEAPESL